MISEIVRHRALVGHDWRTRLLGRSYQRGAGVGEAGLAILMRGGRDDRRRKITLFTARHLLVGPPGDLTTRNETVPFACLQSSPLILAGVPSAFRRQLDLLARRMGVTLDEALECNSLHIQKHMVLRCGLYAMLAEHAVARTIGRRIAGGGDHEAIHYAQHCAGYVGGTPNDAACREVARILRSDLEEMIAWTINGTSTHSV